MPVAESYGNASPTQKRAKEPGGSELCRNQGTEDGESRNQLNSVFSQDHDATVVTKVESKESRDDYAIGEPLSAIPNSGLITGSMDAVVLNVDVSTRTDERIDDMASTPKKLVLERNGSEEERCRICHQRSEEALVELGCSCRGELAIAHRSCIEMWFCTRGSNKCEIFQQVAINIAPPPPPVNVLPGEGAARWGISRRVTGSPLWMAFSILMCGLLLDVLISITLGVSALPVNIIIGVLVLLGVGTAIRLAMDCCHEWTLRRTAQRAESNFIPGYHTVPAAPLSLRPRGASLLQFSSWEIRPVDKEDGHTLMKICF